MAEPTHNRIRFEQSEDYTFRILLHGPEALTLHDGNGRRFAVEVPEDCTPREAAMFALMMVMASRSPIDITRFGVDRLLRPLD